MKKSLFVFGIALLSAVPAFAEGGPDEMSRVVFCRDSTRLGGYEVKVTSGGLAGLTLATVSHAGTRQPLGQVYVVEKNEGMVRVYEGEGPGAESFTLQIVREAFRNMPGLSGHFKLSVPTDGGLPKVYEGSLTCEFSHN